MDKNITTNKLYELDNGYTYNIILETLKKELEKLKKGKMVISTNYAIGNGVVKKVTLGYFQGIGRKGNTVKVRIKGKIAIGYYDIMLWREFHQLKDLVK